jgi:hypothetical protein
MARAIDEARCNGRVSGTLLTALVTISVLLATVGLYAVTAHAVAQRTREIAVQVAFGASSRDVFRLVLTRALAQVALGFTLGVVAVLGWSRLFPSGRAVPSDDPPRGGPLSTVRLSPHRPRTSFKPRRFSRTLFGVVGGTPVLPHRGAGRRASARRHCRSTPMAKAFSVLSWNVEHFGAAAANMPPTKPVGPIIDLIVAQDADVVGIYEVEGSTVFQQVTAKMPDYSFFITEGPQTQEILVGVRKTLSAFVTQRVEFRSGVTVLRPGALVTITLNQVQYCLLFLHLKSLTDPRGFGLRDDQTERALKFRTVLDNAAADGQANYIFLGDLNTMGITLTFSPKDLSGPEEIARLEARCPSRKLTVLGKSEPTTFWPGSTSSLPPSNLDHVVASDHLTFKNLDGAAVSVRGWPQEPTDAKKDAWTEKFSDHAMLFFEVQKV